MGALFLGIAWYMRRHYAWLKNLATVEQVAADLEVDAEGLDRLAKGREIKPRVILDGVPHYNLNDLGEAALLLRSSSPPNEETLLRAAPSAATDDSSLLLPSSAPGEAVETLEEVSATWQPAVSDNDTAYQPLSTSPSERDA
jgi:hypothetical protein